MKDNQKVKKIVFFDTVSDVDTYLKQIKCPDEHRDILSVAMKPTVYSYLKKKGFWVQNTLSYFTNDSHKKALEKSKILIDWLRKTLNSERAYQDIFIFWIRIAVHYCLWTIEVVTKAIDIHQPEVISASFTGKSFVRSLCVEPQENYFGHIVNTIAQYRNLKFENISKKTTGIFCQAISRSVNYIRSLVRFILQDEKFKLWERIISTQNIFGKVKPVFFTTKFYNMGNLAKKLREKYQYKHFCFLKGPVISPFGLPNFTIKLLLNRKSSQIIAQKEKFRLLENSIRKAEKLFSYNNITFADIIAQKTRDNIANHILGLMLWNNKLSRFINRAKPLHFISNGNRADDIILAKLCNQKDIQDILISHGSHTYPKNEYESIEWGEHGRMLLSAPFSHLALQSPLAEGYLKRFPSKSRIIKTGPLIWGTPINVRRSKLLFKKMFNGKYNLGEVKIILHASTPKPSNSLRFYVYETPDEYIQALCDLASTVEKIPNAILIIKFRPSTEISVENLKALVPFSEKVILSTSESFLDTLGMADLVISFSSTTIEEALQNRIPVLLYGGGGRYQHVPAYEINSNGPVKRSAVYHVSEIQNLEYGITKILELKLNGSSKDKSLFNYYIYGEGEKETLERLLKI